MVDFVSGTKEKFFKYGKRGLCELLLFLFDSLCSGSETGLYVLTERGRQTDSQTFKRTENGWSKPFLMEENTSDEVLWIYSSNIWICVLSRVRLSVRSIVFQGKNFYVERNMRFLIHMGNTLIYSVSRLSCQKPKLCTLLASFQQNSFIRAMQVDIIDLYHVIPLSRSGGENIGFVFLAHVSTAQDTYNLWFWRSWASWYCFRVKLFFHNWNKCDFTDWVKKMNEKTSKQANKQQNTPTLACT